MGLSSLEVHREEAHREEVIRAEEVRSAAEEEEAGSRIVSPHAGGAGEEKEGGTLCQVAGVARYAPARGRKTVF